MDQCGVGSVSTQLLTPTYTATASGTGLCTALSVLGLPLCSVTNASNAVAGQSAAYASINTTLGALTLGSESLTAAPTTPLSVTPFTSGYAGFLLSTPNQTVSLSLLQGLTVTTLLNGSPVQSSSTSVSALNLLSLIDVGNDPSKTFVYFAITPGAAFDSLEITDTSDVATVLGSVNVYGACVATSTPVPGSSSSSGGSSGASSSSSGASSSSSGASSSSSGASSSSSGASSSSSGGTVADECGIGAPSSTALLSPTYIATNSGTGLCTALSGLGLPLCSVTNPSNITTGQSNAYAQIDTTLGALTLGSESISAFPATPLSTTPFTSGVAGFVISTPNEPVSLSLLQGLSVTTLRNGTAVESSSSSVSTLNVLSLIDLGNNPAKTFVYFNTTSGQPFDSLELTDTSDVATVLGAVNVYNACVAPTP